MAETSTLSELRDLLNKHLDEGDEKPKNLKDAGDRARHEIRKARKVDAEDAKDGGKDEAQEAS